MKDLVVPKMEVENIEFDSDGCVLIPELTSTDVTAFRQRLQMTQEEFAKEFDLPLATLRNWEQNRAKPVISQARLVFFNKLFDEKAKLIVHVDSRQLQKAA